MITVSLDYYGALRDLKALGLLNELRLEAPVRVSEIKAALESDLEFRIGGSEFRSLIRDSAVSDEERILSLDTVLERSCRLSLLPPVCGG